MIRKEEKVIFLPGFCLARIFINMSVICTRNKIRVICYSNNPHGARQVFIAGGKMASVSVPAAQSPRIGNTLG